MPQEAVTGRRAEQSRAAGYSTHPRVFSGDLSFLSRVQSEAPRSKDFSRGSNLARQLAMRWFLALVVASMSCGSSNTRAEAGVAYWSCGPSDGPEATFRVGPTDVCDWRVKPGEVSFHIVGSVSAETVFTGDMVQCPLNSNCVSGSGTVWFDSVSVERVTGRYRATFVGKTDEATFSLVGCPALCP